MFTEPIDNGSREPQRDTGTPIACRRSLPWFLH